MNNWLYISKYYDIYDIYDMLEDAESVNIYNDSFKLICVYNFFFLGSLKG
jgi:hypothetical protein